MFQFNLSGLLKYYATVAKIHLTCFISRLQKLCTSFAVYKKNLRFESQIQRKKMKIVGLFCGKFEFFNWFVI